MASDIGHDVVDYASGLRLSRMKPSEVIIQDCRFLKDKSPSTAGLALVAKRLALMVAHETYGSTNYDDIDKFNARFGVLPGDRDRNNQFEFYKGLVDQEFTWHFAPAVAVDIVEHFKRA